ncbi:MAG TPA: hypothetical protein VKK79_12985 [Candidatus Lokiarchaeia archaeon]|nr:hypothetical protein [Candidatus Lokiarchaeia archaeon]
MIEFLAEYFEQSGPDNTDAALAVAKRPAEQLGVKTIICASTWGTTAQKLGEVFDPKEFTVVVVTHNYGFPGPGEVEIPTEVRQQLCDQGIMVVTGTLAFSGISSAIAKGLNTYDYPGFFAQMTRRIFSDGTKVCMEIVMMACDAGCVSDWSQDVIAIAGSGSGADTAWVVKPVSSRGFLDIRMKMLLCKPL